MRLICPNCGAQYEVDGDVIPVDGCDVQCSNCGHTWFESAAAPSARMEDPEPVAPERDAAPDPAVDADEDVQAAPVAAKAPFAAVPVASSATAGPAAGADGPRPTAPAPRAPGRTQLDPSIADILREEAAREEAARRSEGGGLEQQQDLGLRDPEPVRPAPPLAAVRASAPGPSDAPPARQPETVAVAAIPEAPTGRRREIFPDIEEINSTLRSSAERDALPMRHAEQVKARKSGRRGFFGTLAVIAALALLYVFADDIAAGVPALADPLTAYVGTIDAGRLWLDAQVQSLLNASETNA